MNVYTETCIYHGLNITQIKTWLAAWEMHVFTFNWQNKENRITKENLKKRSEDKGHIRKELNGGVDRKERTGNKGKRSGREG